MSAREAPMAGLASKNVVSINIFLRGVCVFVREYTRGKRRVRARVQIFAELYFRGYSILE